ncbi:ATP-binding protein [Methylocaldum sp. GT1BB]|uniref:ATP-binding protein n=1 Tax=Methylocaldum sp. GT1BB TaxID=3438963 RepID=UPI003DA02960
MLNNAAKYTPEGGTIWLEAACEQDDAVIWSRDTGEVIPKALLPYLFDVFTQAERTLDRFQGRLGLGLTIVQRCGAARRPGGGQERRPRSGSEFIVRLPLSEGQA